MPRTEMTRWMFRWLLPILLLIVLVLCGRWLYLASHAQAPQVAPDAVAQAHEEAREPVQTLEVLGLGLVVEKFRNGQVLEAIEQAGADSFQSILPKEAEVLKGELIRGQRAGKRSADSFEYAAKYYVEKVPLPGFSITRKPTGSEAYLWDSGAAQLKVMRQGAGLAFTLFVTAEQIYADEPDAALERIFHFFDSHPDVPAVFVAADDGYIVRKFLRGYHPDNILGDPGWKPGDPTEAMTAFILARRDRVDTLIRPHVVKEDYQASRDTPTNRLKTFYFNQEDIFIEKTKQAGLTAEEWVRVVPSFIEQVGKHGYASLLPAWARTDLKGFKPSPWIPVPWTTWQLEEFDALPTLGHLHRPHYASYVRDAQPLGRQARVDAFSQAWSAALQALPAGTQPERLFFDAGGPAVRGNGLMPLAGALNALHPDQDWLQSPRAVDLSARMDDTGAASPFVQIALAVIASYRHGGVSATANLRRADGASVLMVSPPTEPPEQRKRHPGAVAAGDPFKVKLMPEFSR